MNRGRDWQLIFHDERYYQAFLKTLKEAGNRFGSVVHAYCLMGNHYLCRALRPEGQPRSHHTPYQRCIYPALQPFQTNGWPPVPWALQGDTGGCGRLSSAAQSLYSPQSRGDQTASGRKSRKVSLVKLSGLSWQGDVPAMASSRDGLRPAQQQTAVPGNEDLCGKRCRRGNARVLPQGKCTWHS